MSDDLNEENVLDGPSSPGNQYDFSNKVYQVFLSHLIPDFGVTDRDELSGGLSGARTSSVRIDKSAAVKMGQYILKVCLSEKAEREIQKHTGAKASPLLGKYVPELITFKSYLDLSLTGILYRIAGGGHLMRTTLQKSLELHHFPLKSTEALARALLEWNFETLISKTPDLLGSIQEGLGKEHLADLVEKLKGIVKYPDRPRLDLTNLGVWRYNPIHFLLSQEPLAPLRHMSYRIPKGLLHGDLHPGNVIIPRDSNGDDSFQVIDFAASRSGNAFFDLAYLELSILLNSFSGGFHSIAELRRWWELEEYLLSDYLPKLEQFPGDTEGLRRVLPIRRALVQRMEQDNFQDDYWVAFLTASVEAGLNLARKIRRRSRRRVAFLIAASRFHYLAEKLEAIEKVPHGDGTLTTIYWPGEEPPPPLQGEKEDQRISASKSSPSSSIQEGRAKLQLVWPGEVIHRDALYDPRNIVDGIYNILIEEHDQGVLLVGERKFGKSSFLKCLSGLFPKRNIKAVLLDTLNIQHSARSFATEVLSKMCQSAGLQDASVPYENRSVEFESNSFFAACQAIANKKKRIRFMICVDEIDSALATASSAEDARSILQMLSKLLTDPGSRVRLLLTATDKEVLRRYPGGSDFLDNLGTWKIPLCSEVEMKDLIERFKVPFKFEEDALRRIFHYSGGQIYFIKLAARLALSADAAQTGKRFINGQMMDEFMYQVIEPTSYSSYLVRSLHDTVHPTMKNIFYSVFFSKEERLLMRLLTEADGKLQVSSLKVSEVQVANRLYERGYIFKTTTEASEEYQWRIGIWQLFLESQYQLKNRRNGGKQ